MLIVYFIYGYLVTGLIVGSWFCFFKAGRTDPGAAHSGPGFKLIILPAALLLWPLVLRKQIKKQNDYQPS
jgi:hypothetical protein